MKRMKKIRSNKSDKQNGKDKTEMKLMNRM